MDEPKPRSRFADLAVDLAALTGAGLISYGAWLFSHPAGFVIAGALVLTASWKLGREGDA